MVLHFAFYLFIFKQCSQFGSAFTLYIFSPPYLYILTFYSSHVILCTKSSLPHLFCTPSFLPPPSSLPLLAPLSIPPCRKINGRRRKRKRRSSSSLSFLLPPSTSPFKQEERAGKTSYRRWGGGGGGRGGGGWQKVIVLPLPSFLPMSHSPSFPLLPSPSSSPPTSIVG